MLTLQTFATEEEGVAMANDTDFGLAATIVTGDPERAERVAARLGAGTVWVNCFFVRDLRRAVRRQRPVRHRPRGRHLVVRLLLRRQEHRLRPDGWTGPRGRS